MLVTRYLARCILGLCSGSNNKIKLVGDKSLSKRDFSRVNKLRLFELLFFQKKESYQLSCVDQT